MYALVGWDLLFGCGAGTTSPPDRTDADHDGSPAGADCDDGDPAAYPGAPEQCDGVDQDCDGVPEPHVIRWADADADGWGAGVEQVWCGDVPPGVVSNNLDCDDADPTVHPTADEEPCAGLDTNCDGASVPPGGVALSDGRSYHDLGAALDAAPSGAVVSVCPGLFPVSHTSTRPVTIRSIGGSAATTLQADGSTALTVGPGADLVLEGFTVTRDGTAGSAALVINSADVVLRDVVVTGHRGYQAAIEVTNGSLTLDRSKVVDNQNWAAGGWDTTYSPGGGVRGADADITLLDSTVARNDASGNGGGGLSLWGGTLILVRSEVRDNNAYEGGGVWLMDGALLQDAGSAITDNTAYRGGGAYLLRSTLSGGTVSGNDSSGVLVGPDDGSALLDVVLTGNNALEGGGLVVEGVAALSNVAIVDNTAWWWGGGVAVTTYTYDHPSVTMDAGCEVVANRAAGGGGATLTGGDLLSLGAWWGALGVDANDPPNINASTFLPWDVSGGGSFVCTLTGCVR